jgi:hypothetical protein
MFDPAEHWVVIVVIGFTWIAVEFALALALILIYR